MSKLLKYIFLVAIFAYLFIGIDIKELQASIQRVSLNWLLLSMIVVIFSDFCLALRWRYLSKNECNLLSSFEATTISGLLNFILPARLGEISKVIYLNKAYKTRLTIGAQLLIFERSLDILFLSLLSVYAIIEIYTTLPLEVYLISLFLLIFFYVLLIKSRMIRKIFLRIFPRKISNFLIKVLLELDKQISVKNFFISLIMTFLVWTSFFLITFTFFHYVVNLNFLFHEILLIFTVSSIAMSIPFAPGGVGVYQAGMIFALSHYGYSHSEGLSFGLLLHLILLVPSVIVALIVLSRKNLRIKSFV